MEVKNLMNPVFSSSETDTHFILTSNLQGYALKKITTMIKEATTPTSDSGENRAVRRWLRVSVVVDDPTSGVERFRKFFWIPDGVVHDQAETKFMEEESILRIFMPKSVKGVSGVGIEEVKEEEMGDGSHEKKLPEASEEVLKDASGETIRNQEYTTQAQPKPEQEHDRTESLKPDDDQQHHHHPEVVCKRTEDG